jgi:hypothetical protein
LEEKRTEFEIKSSAYDALQKRIEVMTKDTSNMNEKNKEASFKNIER